MQIHVRVRGLAASSALHRHAVGRVEQELRRVAHEITHVVVRITDMNGPKGGLDKRCSIVARGPRVRALSIGQLSANAFSAVHLAAERLARALRRDLRKTTTIQQRALAPS